MDAAAAGFGARTRSGVGYFGTVAEVHEKSLAGATEKNMQQNGTWNVPVRCPQT